MAALAGSHCAFYAAIVFSIGYVFPSGNYVFLNIGVRPALKLNLSSVLFSSAAAGGKSGTAGPTLSAVVLPNGAQKLTIVDSSLSAGTVGATGQNQNAGTTLKVNVAGATAGRSVSAIITDGIGTLKYYGKIGATDGSGNASGLNLTLPVTLDSNNVLKIFVEQINADNLTDYASAPVTVSVTETGTENGTVVIKEAAQTKQAPQRRGPAINEKPINSYEKTAQGFVTFSYNRLLERAPEKEGFDAWRQRIQNEGLTGAGLVTQFIFSQECQTKISGYTNEQFIKFLYNALFLRAPEPEGLQAWLDRMAAGMSKEEVVNGFTRSLEFEILCEYFGIKPYPGYK